MTIRKDTKSIQANRNCTAIGVFPFSGEGHRTGDKSGRPGGPRPCGRRVRAIIAGITVWEGPRRDRGKTGASPHTNEEAGAGPLVPEHPREP